MRDELTYIKQAIETAFLRDDLVAVSDMTPKRVDAVLELLGWGWVDRYAGFVDENCVDYYAREDVSYRVMMNWDGWEGTVHIACEKLDT